MKNSNGKKIIVIYGLSIMFAGFVFLLLRNNDKVFKKEEASVNVIDTRSNNQVIIEEDSLENSIISNDNTYNIENKKNKNIKEYSIKTNESYNAIDEKQSNNDVVENFQSNKDSNDEVELSNNDKLVMQTLDDSLTKINNTSSNDKSFSDSAKATFINIVDFIFYDGEINGVTFDELTDKGKQEVLKLAQKIDNAIEGKIPGYKETISEKASSAFNKASELISKGANNFSNFLKEKLGEEDYNAILKSKDELVCYTKNVVSFIGDVGSSLFNSAKDKLNSWYQDFKNK